MSSIEDLEAENAFMKADWKALCQLLAGVDHVDPDQMPELIERLKAQRVAQIPEDQRKRLIASLQKAIVAFGSVAAQIKAAGTELRVINGLVWDLGNPTLEGGNPDCLHEWHFHDETKDWICVNCGGRSS